MYPGKSRNLCTYSVIAERCCHLVVVADRQVEEAPAECIMIFKCRPAGVSVGRALDKRFRALHSSDLYYLRVTVPILMFLAFLHQNRDYHHPVWFVPSYVLEGLSNIWIICCYLYKIALKQILVMPQVYVGWKLYIKGHMVNVNIFVMTSG